MSGSLRPWLSLVKFGHSVFALPFALTSAWLATGGAPAGPTLFWIIVCCVAARTAAMGFNRLVDREFDAANPRTAGRELPRGVLRPERVGGLVAVSAVLFVLGAFALNPLCGLLSFPVLGVLLGYSFVKRFHWLSHAVLGLALGHAPLGAWLAVRGDLAGDLSVPLLLAAAVLFWVAGFDLIYSCQDRDFDVEHHLHSIPARFGVAAALWLSAAFHLATLGLLVFLAWRAGLGPVFAAALALAAVLLAGQHAIVRPSDLSRVNVAFFTWNGWVGIALFAGAAADLALVPASPG
ncbi:MAG: UbiA-like polyprenyltransferase [Planctomycetota bacterium]